MTTSRIRSRFSGEGLDLFLSPDFMKLAVFSLRDGEEMKSNFFFVDEIQLVWTFWKVFLRFFVCFKVFKLNFQYLISKIHDDDIVDLDTKNIGLSLFITNYF